MKNCMLVEIEENPNLGTFRYYVIENPDVYASIVGNFYFPSLEQIQELCYRHGKNIPRTRFKEIAKTGRFSADNFSHVKSYLGHDGRWGIYRADLDLVNIILRRHS